MLIYALAGQNTRRTLKHTITKALAWNPILFPIAYELRATWSLLKSRRRSIWACQHAWFLDIFLAKNEKDFFLTFCPNWTCISFSGFRFSGKNICWNLRMTSLLKATVWFISQAWSGKFLSFWHTILVAICWSQQLSTFLLTRHFGVQASFFSSMSEFSPQSSFRFRFNTVTNVSF